MSSRQPVTPARPTGPAGPSALRRRWERLRRAVLRRRRPIAALLAAGAVLAAVGAATAPPPPLHQVVVAAHDLPGGRPLTAADLARADLPPDAVPRGATPDPGPLLGRTLAAPVRRGEPVTDVRVLGEGILDGYPTRVAAPVRIADAGVAALLRVGDRVDVVATDPGTGRARVVTRLAPVVALPRGRAGGATGGDAGFVGGALLVVAVPPGTAVDLAGAAATDLLGVILSE